jgi:imidazolonepropionase-like amidohydrolase
MMKPILILLLALGLAISACTSPSPGPTSLASPSQATLVLTNASLIDGTGVKSIPNATLVIAGERIIAVGRANKIAVPSGVEVIDLDGATILPGFINAHVHDAYNEGRLEAWAQAGVTSVRDEGIISGSGQLIQLIALRDQLAGSPQYARLVSAGYMLSVPGGYGQLAVTSPEDATRQVNMELDTGVDLIKIALESGYAGVTNLPNFSPEDLSAIVAAAHGRGRLVTAHITDAKFLPQLIGVGVDDLAHIPAGSIIKSQLQELIEKDIYVVTTLTVFDAYGGLDYASSTLKQLFQAGVKIAMGSDYTLVPQNGFDHFELGMPMHEITCMNEAGMTPMQIIVASTRNAAHVCGLEDELGSLEVGKLADILVINGNPLQDLNALTQVEMVIHNGVIIRQ